MATYKVKHTILRGVEKGEGKVEVREFKPGDSIELTKEEAYEARHALENPPHLSTITPMSPMEKDAYDSTVANPNNPESGVMMEWKVDTIAKENRPAADVKAEEVSRGFGRTGPAPAAPAPAVTAGPKK